MSLGILVLIVLALLLVGAFPAWSYNSGWGYAPSGAVGLILAVVIVLLLMGRLLVHDIFDGNGLLEPDSP